MSDQLTNLIRSHAGLVQGPANRLETPIPRRVQLPLGPVQSPRDGRHAEAFEEAQSEEAAVLGRERSEEREEQLADPARGARPLRLLDPDLHLTVDRDIQKLLLPHLPPFSAPRDYRREPRHLVWRHGEPVLGPEALDRLVDREPIPDEQLLQEHALLATPAGSRGRPPPTPEMDAVVPHQVHQHDSQKGRKRAPPFPAPQDAVVVVDQLEESPGAEFIGLAIGQAAAPAQVAELPLDQIEVGFEESPTAGGRISPKEGRLGPRRNGIGCLSHDRTVAGTVLQSPEAALVEFCESSEKGLGAPQDGAVATLGGMTGTCLPSEHDVDASEHQLQLTPRQLADTFGELMPVDGHNQRGIRN
jgi:hypothetical protein